MNWSTALLWILTPHLIFILNNHFIISSISISISHIIQPLIPEILKYIMFRDAIISLICTKFQEMLFCEEICKNEQ